MKLALFMKVCEGEYTIACEAMISLIESCLGTDMSLFILDDGSPSQVGRRLVEKSRETAVKSADCLELPQSMGFRGSAYRAFKGLDWIAQSGKFDIVVKIDSDALMLRNDFGAFLKEVCPNKTGLYGLGRSVRDRDRVLYWADQLPIGFKRKNIDGVIQQEWQFNRTYPVWWADIARKALANGFQFHFIPGWFWFIGGETLKVLQQAGYLSRDQSRHGFVFNDDILLTTAVCAIDHPVVDLATRSTYWGKFQRLTAHSSPTLVKSCQPYVVHPLKNNPTAWEQRRALKAL
jgi:hypothetical protein